jgi:hypothetical protein
MHSHVYKDNLTILLYFLKMMPKSILYIRFSIFAKLVELVDYLKIMNMELSPFAPTVVKYSSYMGQERRGLFTLDFFPLRSCFVLYQCINSKLSQRAFFLVREKVTLTHVKQQPCIWLELSNAFDCVSQKEKLLLNKAKKSGC